MVHDFWWNTRLGSHNSISGWYVVWFALFNERAWLFHSVSNDLLQQITPSPPNATCHDDLLYGSFDILLFILRLISLYVSTLQTIRHDDIVLMGQRLLQPGWSSRALEDDRFLLHLWSQRYDLAKLMHGRWPYLHDKVPLQANQRETNVVLRTNIVLIAFRRDCKSDRLLMGLWKQKYLSCLVVYDFGIYLLDYCNYIDHLRTEKAKAARD